MSTVVSRLPRKLAWMSATSASKSPASSGLSATSATFPSRPGPESSHASSFATRLSACSTVVAGIRPIARSGSSSSPFTAPISGSIAVHRKLVFPHKAGRGEADEVERKCCGSDVASPSSSTYRGDGFAQEW